jgi:hypothetical protein
VSEPWRTVWRGVAPLLPTAGLEALREALADDDPRLIQGGISAPFTFCEQSRAASPVEAACPVGYCGWHGEPLGTVGEVLSYFDRISEQADKLLHETDVLRWFTFRFWDHYSRGHVFRELLPEVERELVLRQCEQATTQPTPSP